MSSGRDLLYSEVGVHGGHCSRDKLGGFVVAENEWDAFLEYQSSEECASDVLLPPIRQEP